jgi:hypothetical protein
LGCNLLQDITVKSLKTTINNLLTSESTYVDFKVSLEKAKPKTWLKTVVEFANGLNKNQD